MSSYIPDAFLGLPHQNPFYDINNAITYVKPQGASDKEIQNQVTTIERAFDQLFHRFDPTDTGAPNPSAPEDYAAFMEGFERVQQDCWEGDFLQHFHEFAVLFLREHGKHFAGKGQVRTIFSPRSRHLRFFHRDSPEKEIPIEQGQNAILYLGGFYQMSKCYLEYTEKTDQMGKINKALKDVIKLNQQEEELETIKNAQKELNFRYRKNGNEDLFHIFYRLATEFSRDLTQKEIEGMLSPRSRIQSFSLAMKSPRVRQGVVIPDTEKARKDYFKNFLSLSILYLERIHKPSSPKSSKPRSEPIPQ